MTPLLPLFNSIPPDMPLEGSGQLRTRTGEAVEDSAEKLLGIKRLRIDGRKKICWDAELPDGTPLELKSLKPGGRSRLTTLSLSQSVFILIPRWRKYGGGEKTAPPLNRFCKNCRKSFTNPPIFLHAMSAR